MHETVVLIAQYEGKILRWKGAVHCKIYRPSAVSSVKTVKPIEMPFGVWTWVGLRNHGVHIGATWRIRLNRPCAAAMRLFVKVF